MAMTRFYGTRPETIPDVLPAGSVYSRRYKLLEPAAAKSNMKGCYEHVTVLDIVSGETIPACPGLWTGGANAAGIDWATVPMPSETANAVAKAPRTDTVLDGFGNVIGEVTVCSGDTPAVISANKKAVLHSYLRGTLGVTVTKVEDCKPIMVSKANVPKFEDYEVRGADAELVRFALGMPCRWCKSLSCKADAGSYCSGYQRCLDERIALGGANDCEEERASVVRWCEAHRSTWSDPLRDEPALCSECPPERAVVATYKNSRGEPFCGYCYYRYTTEPVALMLTEQSVAARARNEAALATPRPTRQSRELAKGHPASWPSTKGEES